MISSLKKLMRCSWEYEMSRNVPFWHDELTIIHFKEGFKGLNLPSYNPAQIHRGVHADFYYYTEGKGNKEFLRQALMNNFKNKKYIAFLKKRFRTKGMALIRHSKRLKANYKDLSAFFRAYGLLIPMLETTATASKVITKHLLNELAGCDNALELIGYYSRLTKPSPAQQLDNELSKNFSRVDHLALARKLHQKYCWIPISFVGEPWSLEYFLKKVKQYQPAPKKEFKKPDIKISKNLRYYLNLLGEIAYLNEYRKSFFSQSNYAIRPLMDSIAGQFKLGSWRNLSLLRTAEILDLFKGKTNYQKEVIKARAKPCLMYLKNQNQVGYIHGPEVLTFEKNFYINKSASGVVKGVIANKGKVVGTVKVIFEPKEFSKFKPGDILVAKMTSVDFIPIMKKAAAFVTNEGGLACHAAILSREYNKPCIVGTKNATATYKDGDRVEVDANKGMVKKI